MYINSMGKRGRPSKTNKRSDRVEIMLEPLEKQTFRDAADLAGISLSTWIRERLRWVSIRELEEASMPIQFLRDKVRKDK